MPKYAISSLKLDFYIKIRAKIKVVRQVPSLDVGHITQTSKLQWSNFWMINEAKKSTFCAEYILGIHLDLATVDYGIYQK